MKNLLTFRQLERTFRWLDTLCFQKIHSYNLNLIFDLGIRFEGVSKKLVYIKAGALSRRRIDGIVHTYSEYEEYFI